MLSLVRILAQSWYMDKKTENDMKDGVLRGFIWVYLTIFCMTLSTLNLGHDGTTVYQGHAGSIVSRVRSRTCEEWTRMEPTIG